MTNFKGRYAKDFLAGWRTMDFNGHLANTAVTITFAALAMSADGAKFKLENEVWLASGERAATVRSTGGWLDLRARKLVAPPAALLSALMQVPRSPDFTEIS